MLDCFDGWNWWGCQHVPGLHLQLPGGADHDPNTTPTSFPTQHDDSADAESTSYNFTDDALSAGDIAGIVIGAVGGSFLLLLVGVLVGGMVGGKSAAPAAPAGQL